MSAGLCSFWRLLWSPIPGLSQLLATAHIPGLMVPSIFKASKCTTPISISAPTSPDSTPPASFFHLLGPLWLQKAYLGFPRYSQSNLINKFNSPMSYSTTDFQDSGIRTRASLKGRRTLFWLPHWGSFCSTPWQEMFLRYVWHSGNYHCLPMWLWASHFNPKR